MANQPVQDPDYIYKFTDEELEFQDVISRIAYYQNLVEEGIKHGYHDEARAAHEEGVHHNNFNLNRGELEKAVQEWFQIMS